ncbi:hypothetical protein SteCoe_27096 [Stentor coeruleus]|uniref:Uncharacterized protein n=1 Tax=Stentor coeruleus TaxID=5963 RepID=A0A1R2BBE9_9CILI|nr:hypothetical protein SteCoe_27096 [Stentor coeruleus]
MEDIEILNESCSISKTEHKLLDLASINSLKSSLTSFFGSSFPKQKSCKNNSITITKNSNDPFTIDDDHNKSNLGCSEEYSTELNEEEMDEYCERKSVANFQKNYLEMGQWPEVPAHKFQAFKAKYRNMKQKLQICKIEKEKAETVVKKYEAGDIYCKNCDDLKEKNSKTKAALEQAVQLSNMLLKELRRIDVDDDSLLVDSNEKL